MLPIDEYAKSGAWVYVSDEKEAPHVVLEKVIWDGGWVDACGHRMLHEYTHYLPASWVEHAGAMRAALETHAEWARREKAGPDYGGLTRDTHPDGERICSEWFYGNVDLCGKAEKQTTEALAATEWPKETL